MIHSITTSSILYLWKSRTLYIGEYPDFSPITQGAASSLLVGVDGPISITQCNSGETVSGNSFLIPAGTIFIINSNGHRIANCYLDPYNEDFFRLKQSMKEQVGEIHVGNKKEIMQAAAFEKMLCHTLDQKEADRLIECAVFPSIFEAPKRPATDPRIVEIIDFIQDDPTINHTNKTMAKRISVSEVTLQRLFKATTGIPIRRFRLWRRLFVAATLLALGRSITEAALEAGFSDASHFNHVFKDMLGTTPSSIIRRTKNMTIFVDEGVIMHPLSEVG